MQARVSEKDRFIAMLRIELDDLTQHIDHQIRECRMGFTARELTEHVYFENLTVFRNELLGVGAFREILDALDIESFESLESMIGYLDDAFSREVEECALAPAIKLFVKRKIAKVAQLVAV
jgi:hypothetical protein